MVIREIEDSGLDRGGDSSVERRGRSWDIV